MMTLPVPPLGYEAHYWSAEQDGMTSRARLAKATGEYGSAVPPKISTLEFEISGELGQLIEEGSNSLVRFDHYARTVLGTASPTLGPLSSILLRTESTSSSQIENLTVGARQLALAELNQAGSNNAKVVVANVHAMEAALALAGRLDSKAILTMHKQLLGGQTGWEQHAGMFRDQLVWVGSSGVSPKGATYVAPQPEMVPELINDLCRFMEREDLPALLQMAIAHAQFETIHPFVDGNGRTGRALVHSMLRARGIVESTTAPVSAGLLRHTSRYFEALTTYRLGEAAPIVAEFAEASIYAAASGSVLIDHLARELEIAAEKLKGLRPQSMAWRLIPFMVSFPVMNSELVTKLLETSSTSALRALQQLEDRGILEERSGQHRNRIWQHEGILQTLDIYAAGLLRKL